MRRPSARSLTCILACSCALAASVTGLIAQQRERSQIAQQDTWNLSDLYPSVAEWSAAADRFEAAVPQVDTFKGRLGSSATVLADGLTQRAQLRRDFARISAYAALLADQDTRASEPQGMTQRITRLATLFDTRTSYFEPEILRLPAGTVDRYVASEPRLAPYRFVLDNIARRATHSLSADEEALLAATGPMSDAPENVFTVLMNADFPAPTVTLEGGQTVRISEANYELYRTSPNRADRKAVMSAFFQALSGVRRTVGTIMHGYLEAALFAARARHYPSTLEAALDGPNVPMSVYSSLVSGVNRNLPTFHRYLRLRKRLLGLSDLHYYDLYAPLVSSVSSTYTAQEAKNDVLAAMEPLGSAYTADMKRAMDSRWIDLFPTPGKLSGAYSRDAGPDVHPFMLINYNGQYSDVSTLAHELGHTLQSFYSDRAQPYPTSRYPTFVAEVASTFNESLLFDYMLKAARDDQTRLALLGRYLEQIKGTVFRQTQFAEFEQRIHEMAAAGEPVTGDTLSKTYLEITRRYYGHAEGVTVVDDDVANEWSYVPHFYFGFYVFQYATSFTASEALAERVRRGDPEAVSRYLSFLSAGGSKYPIDLLKDAGVDMTTSAPLDLTIARMNAVMDEMEQILARRS